MRDAEYAIYRSQSQKRHEIQLDLKKIASLRQAACSGHMSTMYGDAFEDTKHVIIRYINENPNIYLIDPNNLVVDKGNIGLCMDYERFFYFDARTRTDSWDGVHVLRIVQDPFDLSNFIPKQLPLYGKGNLIEDYAKIESHWLERTYKYNDVIYVRYTHGQTNEKCPLYGLEIKLFGYPVEPKDFQHFVMNQVNQGRVNYDLQRTDR